MGRPLSAAASGERDAVSNGLPFLVATGNHDSDITEAQMRAAGITVLDGQVVNAAGVSVLGDDDPEHNIPFSVDRIKDRPESEEEMAQRLVDLARNRHTTSCSCINRSRRG